MADIDFETQMKIAIQNSRVTAPDSNTCAIVTLNDALKGVVKTGKFDHMKDELNDLIEVLSSMNCGREQFFSIVANYFQNMEEECWSNLNLGMNRGDTISADALYKVFQLCPFIERFDVTINLEVAGMPNKYIERNHSVLGMISIKWEANPSPGHWVYKDIHLYPNEEEQVNDEEFARKLAKEMEKKEEERRQMEQNDEEFVLELLAKEKEKNDEEFARKLAKEMMKKEEERRQMEQEERRQMELNDEEFAWKLASEASFV